MNIKARSHLRLVSAIDLPADWASQRPISAHRLVGVRGESEIRLSALFAYLNTLWANETLEMVHRFDSNGGYSLHAQLLQSQAAAASESRCSLPRALDAALPTFTFQAQSPEDPPSLPPLRAVMQPGPVIARRLHRGKLGEALDAPWPGSLPNWRLTTPFDETLIDGDWALVASLTKAAITEDTRRGLHQLVIELQRGVLRLGAPGEPDMNPALANKSDLSEGALSHWRNLLRRGTGWRFSLRLHANQDITQFALARLARDVFGEHPVSIVDTEQMPELQSTSWPLIEPQGFAGVIPAERCLLGHGIPAIRAEPKQLPPGPGPVLGCTPAGSEVRLSNTVQASHTLVVGASGSGKSNLLRKLAIETIQSGGGLMYVDPHGDDFERLLASVPRKRAKDVVLVDLADAEYSVAINPMTGAGRDSPQRQFVISQLADLIEACMETRESTGPRTRQVTRLILELASLRPDLGTLADAQRLLVDRDFRDYLLSKCKDESLPMAWKAFQMTSGDAGFESWMPFTEARFRPFVSSPVMHALVNRPSTVCIREQMQRGAIVLVRVPTGMLSDSEVRLIGSILLMKVRLAAMAGHARALKQPFLVMLDEFQLLTSGLAPTLFQSLRKFNVGLCVATQSLQSIKPPVQLVDNDIVGSVLANTACKLALRLSPRDARQLAEYTAPEFGSEALTRLANHQAVMALPALGLPPLQFKTCEALPPPHCARASWIRKTSNKQHATPMAEVQRYLRQAHSHLDGS